VSETRLQGRSASPGLAEGVLIRLPEPGKGLREAGPPEAEAAALRQALSRSRAQLVAIAASELADRAAAEMLEFQLAILEDDVLLDPAFKAIADGRPADLAFADAVEAEIELLLEGADDHFAARATDFRDLSDRVVGLLQGNAAALPASIEGAILVGRDIGASVFLGRDWRRGGGIAIAEGSPASHVAMLARSRGVPMVTGLGAAVLRLDGPALLDGATGSLVASPEPATRASFLERRAGEANSSADADALRLAPGCTACGIPVAVLVNLGSLDELEALDPGLCDGAGLVRTEFLFHGGSGLADEEAQLATYARLLAWGRGRPITVRTLDAGGDKPIPGLTAAGESNPFLGQRGIRLSLAVPEVFRIQLRALLRAAALGPLKVMLPMVAVPAELEAARALLHEEAAALAERGIPHALPPLGIMVEVPAAALALDRFDAAFFSIGSNDLTQYTMAAARDIFSVASLNDPLEPAVLRLIAETATVGARLGREVTLCGDAGGDPRVIPALLRAGLRGLSMAPGLVGQAKRCIASVRLDRP